jgi:hypothetical protein
MELYDLIDLLNAVKNEAEAFDSKVHCTTTITRGDEGWTLSIRHKVRVNDAGDTGFSTYHRDFDNLHDLREHMRTLSIGFAFACWEEI